ncbi:hypothetical protein A3448_26175 [Escherichia coli]|nr:hypothetical protein [Escherichia coli]
MMLSVYHTLFQHYALMFLQELQFTGGKRCFCSYLALRDSVGQILRKRLVRTVLIFTESSDQLSRATDRVPGLPASPGYVQ